jgi:hypothetical protein
VTLEGALRSRHARTIAARRLPIQGGALARRRAESVTLGLVPEQRPNRILLQVFRLAYTFLQTEEWPLEIRWMVSGKGSLHGRVASNLRYCEKGCKVGVRKWNLVGSDGQPAL